MVRWLGELLVRLWLCCVRLELLLLVLLRLRRRLLLLAVSPTFHHWVFGGWRLSEPMALCGLNGSDDSMRIGLLVNLVHRDLPRITSIVVGISRVEVVGEIIVR